MHGQAAAFATKAKIIHIDIDPTSISKSVCADIPVVGDAKAILEELNPQIKKTNHPKWLKIIDGWKKSNPLLYKDDGKLRPQYVIEAISEITKGEAIVVTEVGQHQMWSAQYYKAKSPRTFISSRRTSERWVSLPAAIGAKVANPGKTVIDISGDGSFQMNIQEMATAVVNDINIKIVILNNGYLGMVRQWQEMFWEKRYSGTCLLRHAECPPKCNKPGSRNCYDYSPDFIKIADAYGAAGIRVTNKKDVKAAIKKALAINDRPVILEFMVEQEENVLPMVPAGQLLMR